ncbi:MAG: sodium-extruding oxaloacetate decarboxylase subunit alpha [Pseudomonadota bacterium]
MSSKVNITETVLRDGHQSLIATRMRIEDMLPICEKLDAIGFWSLEVWGGATFDSCVRFLKEDPWERLRQLKEKLPNTPLQMLLRGQNILGYRHYSDDVVDKFVELSAQNGIDVFRIFDAMNDIRNLKTSIRAVKNNNKHAQGTICYTTSPVHNLAAFVEMAKQLQNLGCDSVVIKDMAGLLTPYSTSELFKALLDVIDIPVHLHSHATAGLASMCQLKAIEAGCRHIDTAISAFAEGTSHPTTESMVAALHDSDYNSGLNLVDLQEIGSYFYMVRKKYHQFESEFTGIDTRVQVNQVPGGMISNLSNQLKEQGALDKMNAVLEEIPRVRKDLGYPPLVTPTSQIVGTQAVFNVLSGERYKNISNEIKLYFQGKYGKAPGLVNRKIQQMAIGNEDVIDCRPADLLKPELNRLKNEIGELAKSDEDVLTYALFPDLSKDFLKQRQDGTLVAEVLLPITAENDAQCTAPSEFKIKLHGETYHIKVTGTGHPQNNTRPFYMTVDGVPEELMLETLDEILINPSDQDKQSSLSQKDSQRLKATEPGHVTTAMPGLIVDILVKEGDKVDAGTALIITQAMKMETEIQAPIAGTIKAIHISKGDTVNPDDCLIEITDG